MLTRFYIQTAEDTAFSFRRLNLEPNLAWEALLLTTLDVPAATWVVDINRLLGGVPARRPGLALDSGYAKVTPNRVLLVMDFRSEIGFERSDGLRAGELVSYICH
ncbi:MAG: hypothetical protein M1819_003709 [Sarea resinae]|nr:MAG: hypothetical protein M1819_003709 [Sarea resinae]